MARICIFLMSIAEVLGNVYGIGKNRSLGKDGLQQGLEI